MLQSGKLELLLREIARNKVEILVVAEMRWSGKGHFTASKGYTVYYSGNEKGGSNGVAFFANRCTNKYVLGYNPVSDRIISIRLQAVPVNISLLQVCAPTASASDEDISNFYNQLQETVDSIAKKDYVVVMGTSMQN